MNRFVTGDETSCHLDTDGIGRFRFTAHKGQKRQHVNVPMSNFRASIFGGRRGDGKAFAPMIVVKGGDYKFKSKVTATSTFWLTVHSLLTLKPPKFSKLFAATFPQFRTGYLMI
jgi:hypothetical protein